MFRKMHSQRVEKDIEQNLFAFVSNKFCAEAVES